MLAKKHRAAFGLARVGKYEGTIFSRSRTKFTKFRDNVEVPSQKFQRRSPLSIACSVTKTFAVKCRSRRKTAKVEGFDPNLFREG